jgi:hypothetical protein
VRGAAVSGFIAAVAALQQAGDDDDLCAPFLSVLPVSGAAISTLGDPFGSETVSASDAGSARFDELQLDLGEGPCWEALHTGVPVLEPDVQGTESSRWPVALMALREARLGAVFAFPMRVGLLSIGAVDLYDLHAGTLPVSAVRDATVMTDVVARSVLRRALTRAERAETEQERDEGSWSRREVHQASGMLAAQTGVSVGDALLLLRAFAHTSGQTVRELAADVVARRVDLADPDPSAH